VRNASGEYVKADLDSVTAAAKGAVAESGKGFQTSITNANGKYAYPIATFTWILIPAIEKQSKKDHALRDLGRWMLTSGQKQCQLFGYAPLPADLAARELQALDTRK
jgi:phosphate transport system substrate-binding protein